MIFSVALWAALVGVLATLDKETIGASTEAAKKKPSGVRDYAFQMRKERSLKRKNIPPGPRRIGGTPYLHRFEVPDLAGNTIHLDQDHFPNAKAFLLVNIASECGYASQLTGFEKLHNQHKGSGLQVVAFPSNSFNQEPLENKEILPFLEDQYGVTFPVMGKCDINGEDALDLFTWLKVASRDITKVPSWDAQSKNVLEKKDIQWNYEKFLIFQVKRKEFVRRFSYDTTPEDLEFHIQQAFQFMEGTKTEL